MTDLIKLHYSKPHPLNIETLDQSSREDKDYSPFAIRQVQLYNPLYSKFFEMNAKNYDRIALNHPYHVQDMNHVATVDQTETLEKNIFVKFSPLLDPFRYMIGKYDVADPRIRAMPALDSTEDTVHPKVLSPNNASYVDCFFNYLSSALMHKHGFVHGVDFYGSFLGVQDKYRICVTDDLDYLRGSEFFHNHVGELFVIEDPQDLAGDLAQIGGSRRNKQRLLIDDAPVDIEVETVELDIETIELDAVDLDGLKNGQKNGPNEEKHTDDVGCEVVYNKSAKSSNSSTKSGSSSHSSSSSSIQSMNSEVSYSSDEKDANDTGADDTEADEGSEVSEWETEDEDMPSDGPSEDGSEDSETTEPQEEIYGYIHNFPVQMICLEKCDGTLDELFIQNQINEETGASALFQVVMTLLAYQKAFKFTHNDLHTNNIMYSKTDVEYLHYKFAGKMYRVPTYGRIFKLIDFGRSIYQFQEHSFCSDSFAPGGDAATQYNIEPFMNHKKPRLEPNYSFDLCRLGSSMFDFIMDVDLPTKHMDQLQQTVHRWCLDDHGKNVLYKKSGEERYPNFKLYKMIARTVHNHTPEAQLEFPFFKQFLVKLSKGELPPGTMDLDELPVYVEKAKI